jgi:alkylation response protein AidB-like acyl-CoA dehydrogenase
VQLNEVRVENAAVIGEPHTAFRRLEWAMDHGVAALCAEAAGAMQALLELTVEHLRTRTQFGRPIGVFQSLQHRVAEMLADVEQARSMAYAAAADVVLTDAAARRRTLSAAKWMVGCCGRKLGQAATQLHGGMGMTDEGLSGQYFKRLVAIDKLWGDSEHHAELFASTI